MKIQLHCRECFLSGPLNITFTAALPNDDLIQEIECPKGHKSKIIITRPKFQILFEVGVNAIVDGYYREAVTSFTASLERSYEYLSRVILLQSSCNDEMFKQFWKPLAKSSERQLGAFLGIWVARFGTCALPLGNKQVELRNNVTHNGKIPTRAESIAFGDEVFKIMFHNMQILTLEHGIDHAYWHLDAQRISDAFTLDPTLQPQDVSVFIQRQDQSGKVPSISVEEYVNQVKSQRDLFETLPDHLADLAGTVDW